MAEGVKRKCPSWTWSLGDRAPVKRPKISDDDSRGWRSIVTGFDMSGVTSYVTSKLASLKDALVGTVLGYSQSPNSGEQYEDERDFFAGVDAVDPPIDALDTSVEISELDTEEEYQKIWSAPTFTRKVPTVEIKEAKPVVPVSRSQLKQQLLDKMHTAPAKGGLQGKDVASNRCGAKSSSRGARILDLIGHEVDRNDGFVGEDSYVPQEEGCIQHDGSGSGALSREVSLMDMAGADGGPELSPVFEQRGGGHNGPHNNYHGSLDQVDFAKYGGVHVSGDVTSAFSPSPMCEALLFGEPDNQQQNEADDIFGGFDIATPSSPQMDYMQELSIFDKDSHMDVHQTMEQCMVIQNHTADLSPDDATLGGKVDEILHTEKEKEIPKPKQECVIKSAKALLKKKVILKRAAEDALLVRLREVIINRHLSDCFKQGHAWARLDARGIELNTKINHAALENEVLTSIREEKGDDILQNMISEVEKEWEHVLRVREKYSCAGEKEGGTPQKSILKKASSGNKDTSHNQTIRWATENTQHVYPTQKEEAHESNHQQACHPSTRGLRMLLASASPSLVQPSGARVAAATTASDNPTAPDAGAAQRKASQCGRSRSRTTLGGMGGKSQGQRLFQALQQAASTAVEHQSSLHVPKTLSTPFAMTLASQIDINHAKEENGCFSNTTSSSTASDNTTSSTSSTSRGGRWTATEVDFLIRGFKEYMKDGTNRNIWTAIHEKYSAKGISECRTTADYKDKWRNLRRTALKNASPRYVKLTEETVAWLRSDDSKPSS